MMPRGAKILCVQTQGQIPCLWAVVNDQHPLDPRTIWVAGTGHPIAVHESMAYVDAYIGTFQLQGGALIFHVFERQPT